MVGRGSGAIVFSSFCKSSFLQAFFLPALVVVSPGNLFQQFLSGVSRETVAVHFERWLTFYRYGECGGETGWLIVDGGELG
jgi:hypothetical protein